MILTGKCKEDFLKHTLYTNTTFDLIDELFQTALIIDFFDSIGYHIKTYPYLGGGQVVFYPSFIYLDENNNSNERNVIFDTREQAYFNTRQQATNEAIKKANLIYNGL